MSNTFQPGDEVYLEDGRRARIAAVGKDEFFVNVQYGPDEDDEDNEPFEPYYSDKSIVTKRVFKVAPVAVVDELVAASQAKLADLNTQIHEAMAELRSTDSERQRLIEKAAQVPALQSIEAILDGKVTHIVTANNDDGIQVLTAAQMTRNRESHHRLLIIKGNYSGEFKWVAPVGTYGSESDCIPCTSVVEASRIALEMLDRLIVESKTNTSFYWHHRIVKSCKNLGVPVPQEVQDRIADENRQAIVNRITEGESSLKKWRGELAKLSPSKPAEEAA